MIRKKKGIVWQYIEGKPQGMVHNGYKVSIHQEQGTRQSVWSSTGYERYNYDSEKWEECNKPLTRTLVIKKI